MRGHSYPAALMLYVAAVLEEQRIEPDPCVCSSGTQVLEQLRQALAILVPDVM